MSGRIRLVRTSERSAFKKCRWAWDLSFLQGLRQRRDAPVLRFGTLVHIALAEWYVPGKKRGKNPVKAFLKAYDEEIRIGGEFTIVADVDDADPEADKKWSDARELGVDMLEMYLETYGDDKDWEVLATEQAFRVPVFSPKNGRYLFTYAGILDLVCRQRSTGRIWIWDHKTTIAINLRALGLNEQFGSYWAFGTEWLQNEGIINSKQFNDLSGLMVNYLRRARRDDRPRNELGQALNKDGSVSKRQQAEVFHREPTYRSMEDRERVRRRAMNDWWEMEQVRRGKLEADKSPSIFNCPNCPWLDVCELHETGNDWEYYLARTTEEYDPYEIHEIEDSEKR